MTSRESQESGTSLKRIFHTGLGFSLECIKGGMMDTEEFLNLARDPERTTAEIDAIFDAHAPCFMGTLCEVCGQMPWDGEELLICLAGNPALSPQQQDRVFAAAQDWQGRIVYVLIAFAANSNISDDVKAAVLSAEDFIGFHVGDDLPEVLEQIVDASKSNPRFTAQEWKVLEDRAAELSALFSSTDVGSREASPNER